MIGIGLDFVEFERQHTGVEIAHRVKTIINEYKLDQKILAIVVDNAKSNDVAIKEIATIFNLDQDTFPTPEELHIRCFGHTMNLACKGEFHNSY